MTSCQTVKENATEPNARLASEWVKKRSGFIQNAVQAITHVAVYATDQQTFERQRTIEIIHAISGNLNALIANNQVDSEAIKQALKINEPYFGPIMDSIANIIQAEMGSFRENGYADLSLSILEAVSKGMAAGTVQ
jgi:hypothetical protein